MTHSGAIDIIWWITVVEIPALAALFWLVLRTRIDAGQRHDQLKTLTHQGEDKLWCALNAYKLDVAKTYASNQRLQEVEHRLIRHLVRIEDKLDSIFKPATQGGSGNV